MRRFAVFLIVIAMTGCASLPDDGTPPAGAVAAMRTEANGDRITEYRVSGQLRMVKVETARGLVYFLHDRDGDGVVDKAGDNPPVTYFKLFGW